jgi:hypothetical protein
MCYPGSAGVYIADNVRSFVRPQYVYFFKLIDNVDVCCVAAFIFLYGEFNLHANNGIPMNFI